MVAAVNHDDCIATLLASPPGQPGEPETAANRRAAEEHAAWCSDCWSVLRTAYELMTGELPAESERIQSLFGCDAVQDRLYLLTDLTAADIRNREPTLAHHLGWCIACRERLVELIAVERAAARGELEPLLAPAPQWRETATRFGAKVREVVGHAVVRVGRAAAVFTEVPEGFLVGAVPVPVGAMRGLDAESSETTAPGLGQEVQFALADSGLWVELRLEAQSDELVAIALRVSGSETSELSVQLRVVEADRAELVARYTVRGTAPVLVKGVRPGRYVLELHERERTLRFKLRFDVELAA
jgi:hypothetical protein